MNVRRFFGANMTEVLARIRAEVGPDAVILSSRSVRQPGLSGLFKPRVLEVMVAHEDSGSAAGMRPAPRDALKNADQLSNREKALAIAREVVATRPAAQATPAPPLASPQPAKVRAQDKPAAKPNNGAAAPAPRAQPSPDEKDAFAELGDRLDRLSDMILQMSSRIEASDSQETGSNRDHSIVVQPYLQRLLQQEVDANLAHAIATRAEEAMAAGEMGARDAMRGVIIDALGKPETIKLSGKKQTVVMLAGPTGVGKTTSLIKLAAQFVVQQDAKVGLINADTYRIGAKEQIASYADILRSPLRVVYSPDEMTQAMADFKDRDIVFVDTPGKPPNDERHKDDLTRYMEICRPTNILLAVSSASGNLAVREVVRYYTFLARYALLVTKMDEVQSAAMALNTRFMAKMPLSYVAWGQGVPDDISAAKPERIAESLLGSGEPW